MKKIVALALAIMLVIALAAPTFAAGEVSVSITHIAPNHTYKAYQLFDGTLDGSIITDISWGPGVDGAALLAALKADTTEISNSDGSITVKFSELFANCTTADDVVHVLETFTSDGDRLEHFAKIAAGFVKADAAKPSTAMSDNQDGTYTYTIPDLDPGYYIILDETAPENIGAQDYKTRYVLALTSKTDLYTKGDYTTVRKNVSDILDDNMTDYVASILNRPVYFELIVSLDDDLAEFDQYYLELADTMSKGLTFQQIEMAYIEEVSGARIHLFENGAWKTTPDINSVTENSDGSTSMVIAWNDLKSVYADVAGDDVLIVKYSAIVNEDAVYGTAMPNEVTVKFSNGPSPTDRGVSVPDYAFVFSFGLNVLKVDADNTADVLPGAEFLLYYLHGTDKYYAVVENGKAVAWTPYATAEEVEAAKAAIDNDATLSEQEKTDAKAAIKQATTLVTDSQGNILVNGLDQEVNYYLHETKAPAGYNTLFTDVRFSIHPAYTVNASGVPEVASISYQVDGVDAVVNAGDAFEAGRVVVTVTNNKGNTLPSTGGFGTTMFYLIGGTMVAAAVVLLVSKKRMSVM